MTSLSYFLPVRASRLALVMAMVAIGAGASNAASNSDPLPGWVAGTCAAADEQWTTVTAPGLRAVIQAPRPVPADRPLRLVLFALPNGNTIEQTIGHGDPALHFRYRIQHIGAQARWWNATARALSTTEPLVAVAYCEADKLSFPAWRSSRGTTASSALNDFVGRIVERAAPLHPVSVEAVAHSGGGSMLFGIVEASAPPGLARFDRLAFLDANYNFNATTHTETLKHWLTEKPSRVLAAVAYDDREIMLNGKKVVTPTGGTLRATLRMVGALGPLFPMTTTADESTTHVVGLAGRIDLRTFANPQNKILHTVLVEKNGFIHALAVGRATGIDMALPRLMGDATYSAYVEGGAAAKH